jgi:hypothetical protein
VHPDENWSMGDWEEDPDRYKSIRCLMTVVGNFIADTRKKFGAYTAISS